MALLQSASVEQLRRLLEFFPAPLLKAEWPGTNTDGQYRRPRHHIPPTSHNLGQHFDPLQLPSTHRQVG